MSTARCAFCTATPLRELAVSSWTTDPEDRSRLTILLCGKHMVRVQKAGPKGYAHGEEKFKAGFW
ncbi:MAG: hypothetical protein DWI58_15970 [Chloroflexi bacterium]|nr:MAG: hypothetical protein DWI58_15970 [Chloroflexota bacterium]